MGFFTEGDIVPPGFPIAKYNTSSKKKDLDIMMGKMEKIENTIPSPERFNPF